MLIKCNECGKEVSDKANTCPNCGAPIKEDEIKKGQQTFVKRLIAAVIVFLVVFIVELAIGLVAPKGDNDNIWGCFDCLVNNECDPA